MGQSQNNPPHPWSRRRFLRTAAAGLAGMQGLPLVAGSVASAFDEADARLFSDDAITEIEIVFADPDWQMVIDDETYLEATLIHGSVEYPGVGVRHKGNSSLHVPGLKKPFKVDVNKFNDGQDLFGVTKFALNNSFMDPTMMRERLAHTMMTAMGVPCSRSAFCRLTIGGVHWGLYILVESVVKPMTTRFWADLDGNRFQCDPRGDLTWQGPDQIAYEDDYTLETNETENDWWDLIALIGALNNTAIGSLPDVFAPLFDVDNFLRFLAVNTLLSNLDSHQGSGHNCYVLDIDPSVGRFVHIPWDLNEAFGAFQMGMTAAQLRVMDLEWVGGPRPLITRLLAIEDWHDLFVYRVQRTLDTVFRSEWVDARVSAYHALIDSQVQEDPNKLYSYQQYLANQTNDVTVGAGPAARTLPGLRSFTADRAAYARGVVGSTPPASAQMIADHLTGQAELSGVPFAVNDRDDDGVMTLTDLVRAVNGD